MKILKAFYWTFFSVLLLNTTLSAQIQSPLEQSKKPLPIKILIKQKSEKTLIRWAFDDPNEWYMNRNMSFDIFRANLADGANKKYISIAENIKTASKEILEAKFSEDQTDLGVAAILQAHYGEWESQGKNSDEYGFLDKKEELENKYLTLLYSCDINWETSLLAGLGYEDKTTKTGEEYIYRLVPSDSNFSAKHKVADQSGDVPLVISEWAENENQIVLAWDRDKYEKEYTGFFIEKSKDGSNFTQMNKIPYVHLISEDVSELPNILWSDSVSNYTPHYYRISGIDAFGQRSQPSESIKLMGRDRTPPNSPKATVKLDPEQRFVEVRWEGSTSDDVDKYVIQKSNKIEGNLPIIGSLDKTKRQYRDENVELVGRTFYKVCAVDTAMNYACSEPAYLVIEDKIPPASPQNVQGNINAEGVVMLTWDMGAEVDLMGYHVQVSNGRGRVFTSSTDKPLKTNMWTDTIPLKVLTEDIYYRVTAVDFRSNTSKCSEIIRLLKPDIVPPNASVFSGYEVLDSSVYISFIQSSSKDVELIELQRKEFNESFVAVEIITGKQNTFVDNDVKSNTQYTYRLVTTDDAGNTTMSPSNISITTKNINSNLPINLEFAEEGENIELSWNLKGSETQYVKLYSGSKKKLKPFKTFKSDMNQYKFVPQKGEEYRIRAFFTDGTKSPYSNSVKINTN